MIKESCLYVPDPVLSGILETQVGTPPCEPSMVAFLRQAYKIIPRDDV